MDLFLTVVIESVTQESVIFTIDHQLFRTENFNIRLLDKTPVDTNRYFNTRIFNFNTRRYKDFELRSDSSPDYYESSTNALFLRGSAKDFDNSKIFVKESTFIDILKAISNYNKHMNYCINNKYKEYTV